MASWMVIVMTLSGVSLRLAIPQTRLQPGMSFSRRRHARKRRLRRCRQRLQHFGFAIREFGKSEVGHKFILLRKKLSLSTSTDI
jgi:hypothetical protein